MDWSEHEGTEGEGEQTMYLSTTYSSKIKCGICGAPVRNVPTMYENWKIEWRCAKCLRRDKPVLEDQIL